MEKTVEKIIINTEGIDVVLSTNGVSNVTQLSLEPQGDEVEQIFKKYNLATGVIYHYDEKIIRALEENKDQLADYLEACRRASYPAKRVEAPESLPEIEYDLRGLKDSFQNIEDDKLRKIKQVQIYNKAKEVYNMLRGKTTFRMGILDRAYFSVQELLQNRNKNTDVLLLGDSSMNRRAEFKAELSVEQGNVKPELASEKAEERAPVIQTGDKERAE